MAEEVKACLPIVDAVRTLVPVEKLTIRGKRATGLCPLHTEKTPSFIVYLDTNSWVCFGCRRGGDVIRLYALYHGISDGEAIRQLADYLGISRTLSPAERRAAIEARKQREREKRLEELLQARLNRVADQLIEVERTAEARLLRVQDAGYDPLEDPVCQNWLASREYVQDLLDTLLFGDPKSQILALLEAEKLCR